jgi:hypothetical protein
VKSKIEDVQEVAIGEFAESAGSRYAVRASQVEMVQI